MEEKEIDRMERLVASLHYQSDLDSLESTLKTDNWRWLWYQLRFERLVRDGSDVKIEVYSDPTSLNTYDGLKQFLDWISEDYQADPSVTSHPRWPSLSRLATRHLVFIRKNTEWPEFSKIMPHRCSLPDPSDISKAIDVLVDSEKNEDSISATIAEAFCPRGNWSSSRETINDQEFLHFCLALLAQQDSYGTEEFDVDREMLESKIQDLKGSLSYQNPIDLGPDVEKSMRLISHNSQSRVMDSRICVFASLLCRDFQWEARIDCKLIYFVHPEEKRILFHTDVDFHRVMDICRKEKPKYLCFTEYGDEINWFLMDPTLDIMTMAIGLGGYEFDPSMNLHAMMEASNRIVRGMMQNGTLDDFFKSIASKSK